MGDHDEGQTAGRTRGREVRRVGCAGAGRFLFAYDFIIARGALRLGIGHDGGIDSTTRDPAAR